MNEVDHSNSENSETNNLKPDESILSKETAASAIPTGPVTSAEFVKIEESTFLDSLSLEDVVELKIKRFLDQIGTFYPENLYEMLLQKFEKPLVKQIMIRTGGNQVQASKILGINRNTLRKKIKIYGL